MTNGPNGRNDHVRIALREDCTLSAEALARSGVWALTRDPKDARRYRITHVPTGRCLPGTFDTVDAGCEAVTLLGTRAPEWARDATFGESPTPLPEAVHDVTGWA